MGHRFVFHVAIPDVRRVRALQQAYNLPGADIAPGLDPQVVEVLVALFERAPRAVVLAANNPALEALAADGRFAAAVSAGSVRLALTEASASHPAYLDEAAWRAEIESNRRAAAAHGWHTAGYVPSAFCFPERLAGAFGNAGLQWMAACGGEASVSVSPALTEALHDLAGDTIRGGAVVAEAVRNYAELAAGLTAPVHGALVQGHDWQAAAILAGLFDLGPVALEQRDPAPGPPAESHYRPLLRAWVRADGLYPPPDSPVEAPDAYLPGALYARYPFLVWDGGRLLHTLLSDLAACFDAPGPEVREGLRGLAAYPLWGPRAREPERMIACLETGAVAVALRAALTEGRMPSRGCAADPAAAVGLRAALSYEFDHLAVIVDDHLRAEGAQGDPAHLRALREAREHRLRAAETLMRLEGALGALTRSPGAWFRVADMLDVYARELYTALAALHRLRKAVCNDAAFERNYRMLTGSLYPPQLPAVLDRYGAARPGGGAGAGASAGVPGRAP